MTENTGIKLILLSRVYSAKGLRAALHQQVLLAGMLIPRANGLEVFRPERTLMITAVILVLIIEPPNSAVEAIVDRIGSEQHENSGQTKDMGTAAVLISPLLTVYVKGTVLWSKLLG